MWTPSSANFWKSFGCKVIRHPACRTASSAVPNIDVLAEKYERAQDPLTDEDREVTDRLLQKRDWMRYIITPVADSLEMVRHEMFLSLPVRIHCLLSALSRETLSF